MKLICVFGPTACHKSETAIYLAEKLNGEILSCDSVAVYKGFDIGSAKPTVEERRRVPHHLIDIAEPEDRSFSVAAFQLAADAVIEDCAGRNKQPILAGGSGLYADAVLREMGYAVPGNAAIRTMLASEYDEDPEFFRNRLKAVDLEAGERIPLKDKKRLVRAMEVYTITGRPFSSFNEAYIQARKKLRYDAIMVGLIMERSALYERINTRVDGMMAQGLLEEARMLFNNIEDNTLPAMQSIGYAQLFSYFRGEVSLQDAVDQIKLDTRHLAKRQLTWFKREESIHWFDCGNWPDTLQSIEAYCQDSLYK